MGSSVSVRYDISGSGLHTQNKLVFSFMNRTNNRLRMFSLSMLMVFQLQILYGELGAIARKTALI